jgi:glycosyltransferase involved in cell wall biosynthesis
MGDGPARRPLDGKRVCLVFDHSLSHYSRLHLEIAALQRAGAFVELVTPYPIADAPASVRRTFVDLVADGPLRRAIGEPRINVRVVRRIDRIVRRTARSIAARWYGLSKAIAYDRVLAGIANRIDAFWVIDFPRLGSVLRAARKSSARVVYETVDLVPEYEQHGHRHRESSLRAERRLIGQVDGFITAGESYADYYVEMYGDGLLRRRPVVIDNMPAQIVDHIKTTGSPIRLLFFGSLLFDRPIDELVEAVGTSTANVTLTFQGKNYLDELSMRRIESRIEALGLGKRIEILGPCPPESTVQTASAYDVGIVALRGRDENERRASTAKLFTYMASGLAVLGTDLPGIARLVRAHGNGILVDGVKPGSWAAGIDQLGTMLPASIDEMKQRSLNAARQYAWDRQEPSFVGEFVRALSSQGPA